MKKNTAVRYNGPRQLNDRPFARLLPKPASPTREEVIERNVAKWRAQHVADGNKLKLLGGK